VENFVNLTDIVVAPKVYGLWPKFAAPGNLWLMIDEGHGAVVGGNQTAISVWEYISLVSVPPAYF
jgi:hypothetical protein